VIGTRQDAEIALARMKVADQEKRLPSGGTRARTVDAVFELYLDAVEMGVIELAPSTVVTTRSACRRMAEMVFKGYRFGSIPLSRLTWQEIEGLYAAMRPLGTSLTGCAVAPPSSPGRSSLLGSAGSSTQTRRRTRRAPGRCAPSPTSPRAEEVRDLLAEVGERDPEMGDAATVLARPVCGRASCWHCAGLMSSSTPTRSTSRLRSDWRDVPLTAGAIAAFERQRARRRVLLKRPPATDHYVFPALCEGTEPMRPDALSNRWAAARGTTNITLQHLRHFAATAMVDAGESYRTVADILGNSESTLRLHYDGRTDVGKRRAIEALELS
jgi:hypothetical protein